MLRLKAACVAGDSIQQVCDDAQRVADMLGVVVEFRFNDVECSAVPNGCATTLAENQQVEQGRKSRGKIDYRFASSRRD